MPGMGKPGDKQSWMYNLPGDVWSGGVGFTLRSDGDLLASTTGTIHLSSSYVKLYNSTQPPPLSVCANGGCWFLVTGSLYYMGLSGTITFIAPA
jgi:hypothetical protein